MANTVKVKRSATPSKVPTTSDLDLGEIAVNTYDGKMYIKKDDGTASVVEIGGGSGSGDVVGPSSSTDNAVARFDTTTGKLIQNSVVTIDDAGSIENAIIDSFTNTVGADHVHYKIKANETIVKGNILKYVGWNAGENAIEVVKVSSATDVAIGMAHDNLATGEFGLAVVVGTTEGFDTSAFTAGTILYPNTSGGLTATKPTSGTYQACAFVIRSQSVNGAYLVNFGNPVYVEASTNTANTAVIRDGSGNFSAGTITAALSGNATTATTLATGRTIGITGDLTYTSPSFNGSGNVTAAGTLATVNSNVGSFTNASVTVNAKGLVTAVSSGTAPVTSVTGTAPIASSGGATPAISISQATTSTNGYLSSTDWNTFNNKTSNTGTVTSVSGTGTASGLSLSGTVTTSGSLTLSGTVNSLAAGTYGISISGSSASCTGNAATATTATTANALNTANSYTVAGFTVNGTVMTVGNSTNSSINMVDTDEGTRIIHCNSNRIGFLNQSGGWGSYCNDDGSWTSDVRLYSIGWTTTGRNYSNEWIQFDNYSGLYSPLNGAHFLPNNGTYGAWKIQGSRNGWGGLEFDNNTTLMMNGDSHGFHKNDTGWRFYNPGGSIYCPGEIQAAWSDARFKENLRPVTTEALDLVNQFKVYRFNWNQKVEELDLPIKAGSEQLGLIAQEVQAVFPDAVAINQSLNKLQPDGSQIMSEYLTIKYDRITPLLVQSINELTKQVNELRAEIAELKGQK